LQLAFVSKTLSELSEVRHVAGLAMSGLTFEKCVSLAYNRFHILFRDAILRLVRGAAVVVGAGLSWMRRVDSAQWAGVVTEM
jgi:hypothetical protein